MPKYYEISEASAKRAKDMNSYSDYAPGSATAGTQAGRFPLPHDPSAAETGKRPDPPGVLLL